MRLNLPKRISSIPSKIKKKSSPQAMLLTALSLAPTIDVDAQASYNYWVHLLPEQTKHTVYNTFNTWSFPTIDVDGLTLVVDPEYATASQNLCEALWDEPTMRGGKKSCEPSPHHAEEVMLSLTWPNKQGLNSITAKLFKEGWLDIEESEKLTNDLANFIKRKKTESEIQWADIQQIISRTAQRLAQTELLQKPWTGNDKQQENGLLILLGCIVVLWAMWVWNYIRKENEIQALKKLIQQRKKIGMVLQNTQKMVDRMEDNWEFLSQYLSEDQKINIQQELEGMELVDDTIETWDDYAVALESIRFGRDARTLRKYEKASITSLEWDQKAANDIVPYYEYLITITRIHNAICTLEWTECIEDLGLDEFGDGDDYIRTIATDTLLSLENTQETLKKYEELLKNNTDRVYEWEDWILSSRSTLMQRKSKTIKDMKQLLYQHSVWQNQLFAQDWEISNQEKYHHLMKVLVAIQEGMKHIDIELKKVVKKKQDIAEYATSYTETVAGYEESIEKIDEYKKRFPQLDTEELLKRYDWIKQSYSSMNRLYQDEKKNWKQINWNHDAYHEESNALIAKYDTFEKAYTDTRELYGTYTTHSDTLNTWIYLDSRFNTAPGVEEIQEKIDELELAVAPTIQAITWNTTQWIDWVLAHNLMEKSIWLLANKKSLIFDYHDDYIKAKQFADSSSELHTQCTSIARSIHYSYTFSLSTYSGSNYTDRRSFEKRQNNSIRNIYNDLVTKKRKLDWLYTRRNNAINTIATFIERNTRYLKGISYEDPSQYVTTYSSYYTFTVRDIENDIQAVRNIESIVKWAVKTAKLEEEQARQVIQIPVVPKNSGAGNEPSWDPDEWNDSVDV